MATSFTRRRFISDVIASATGLMILLFALVAFDGRVREQFTTAGGVTAGAAQFSGVGEQLSALALVVAYVVRERTLEHTHLTIFAGAAIVLVIFLLRL